MRPIENRNYRSNSDDKGGSMRAIFFSDRETLSRHFAVLLLATALLPGAGSAAPLFEQSIAPLLEANCVDCHRPGKQKGELDLSTAEGVMAGGESGPVVVPGSPAESLLYEQVHHGEMPKRSAPLSTEKQQAIHDWIASGAGFRSPPAPVSAGTDQHDVLPILLLRCTACHGGQKREGDLDLRSVASIEAGGRSGPALVPGSPDSSRIIQRIESQACPPQALLLKSFVKRPPDSELETLRHWIAEGAPVAEISPDVATRLPDPLVDDEDRAHWSFRPPVRTAGSRSLDDFISARLAEANLDFTPEADRVTLVRRAWIELLGLPPTPEEWRYWSSLDDPNWFPRMVDHLLESPHYGERWGRYWLDLAGYADSEGGTSDDPLRPVAWKYRDYVVDAFNADKPYDEFLLEQIAGDELIDIDAAPEITEEMVENLVATGFLRMGIDETGSRTMNFVENRVGVIADAIEVIGSGVMGLTLECVRCHSHKYDPIPHRDYYRLKAVFQGALDEYDWLSFKHRVLEVGTPAQRTAVEQVNPPLESELSRLEALKRKQRIQWQRTMLQAHYPAQSESDREATFIALKKADNTRSQEQRLLVEKLQQVMVLPADRHPEAVQHALGKLEQTEEEISALRDRMAPSLAIRALWDRGEPSPTYIHRRGVPTSPGRLVGPGVPSVLTNGRTPFEVTPPFPNGTPKTGRRLAFARWLTDPEHPLTARVMVNRIWHHHFGRGLVASLENFGMQGEAPSHPELLDWLALEFVDRGWSIKEMHRLMLHSRTWKQSSDVSAIQQERDPGNVLLSRMPLRRLDAEALRDSLLFVSGRLDPTTGGPPDRSAVDSDGNVHARPRADGRWRRSLYLPYRRTEMPTMMETFDYPEMGPNCVQRSESTVSLQGLLMLNDPRVREWAGSLANRIDRSLPLDVQVDAVYAIALGREPAPEERRLGISALETMLGEWPDRPDGPLEAFCHTILNSAAFLYVD